MACSVSARSAKAARAGQVRFGDLDAGRSRLEHAVEQWQGESRMNVYFEPDADAAKIAQVTGLPYNDVCDTLREIEADEFFNTVTGKQKPGQDDVSIDALAELKKFVGKHGSRKAAAQAIGFAV